MIRYALACAQGHEFDGWFAGADAYEAQRAAGEIACPTCGGTEIDKRLMVPAVATARRRESMPLAAPTPEHKPTLEMLRTIRRHLTEQADYVGDRFAEEARKIHYEEAEKRGIYGEATPQDVRGLIEEGIEFHPLPVLPEDRN